MDEQNQNLEWYALEYEEKERSRDWFWALGIATVAAAATAIIYSNYFFATLIVLSGVLLFFFAVKKPDTLRYGLTHNGVKIGSRVYLYSSIKSFYVQLSPKPVFFIKTERIFMPIISMSIEGDIAEEIHNHMSDQNIPEEEMHEHASMQIIEFFGF